MVWDLCRRRTALRTLLLVLLAFGVVVKPGLAAVGELHAVEHAALAAQSHGHDHDHQDSHSGNHAHPEPAQPVDHASGSHSLMHQADPGTFPAIWASSAPAPTAPPVAILPIPDMGSVPLQVPATPFRPPIA